MDRTGLKILENNKNIQSIISVNTNILLRRFRLKFLRIMCSTSCYKERVNFENTLSPCIKWCVSFELKFVHETRLSLHNFIIFLQIDLDLPTTVTRKKIGRQNHALTQWKMLYCKTVLNIIIYHHVV
jgi:hypothetical protein